MCGILFAFACGSREYASIEKSAEEAQKQNKDILLIVTMSDECYACNLLEENVFQDKHWTPEDSFIVCHIDHTANLKKDAPEVWQAQELFFLRFGIDSFPTVMLCTPEAWPYYKGTYHDEDAAVFLEYLEEIRAERSDLLAALLKTAAAAEEAEAALTQLEEWGVAQPYHQLKALAAPHASGARYAVELAQYWSLQNEQEQAGVWEKFLQEKWPDAWQDYRIWLALRDVEKNEQERCEWAAAWAKLSPLWGQAVGSEAKYQLAAALGELAYQLRRRDACLQYFRLAYTHAPDARMKSVLARRLEILETQDF
jgi:thioredoxin-related protein